MATAPVLVSWRSGQESKTWIPTTLDQLNKYEELLEEVLAATPELMGLESRRSGIRGPFRVFRQLELDTPSGRTIYPDIVLLAASGHVVVVEVKRSVNPELRNRAVIAQIIDYASSFAALSEDQVTSLFNDDSLPAETWPDLVQSLFPDEPNTDELSDELFSHIQNGELNLVIACDKIPIGLPDVVAGIASQETLGFDLDLVEVTPFVEEVKDTADIIFAPSTRLRTEIVSRTAVTVNYRQGDGHPSTTVQTTSLEDIKKNVRTSKSGANPDARAWTPHEVEEEFRKDGNETALALLDFVKQHSADGEYIDPGKKVGAVFGYWVRGLRKDGTPRRRGIFNSSSGWGEIYIYLHRAEKIVSSEDYDELLRRLKEIFGNDINLDLKETSVKYETLRNHMVEFQDVMLWLKEQAERTLSE